MLRSLWVTLLIQHKFHLLESLQICTFCTHMAIIQADKVDTNFEKEFSSKYTNSDCGESLPLQSANELVCEDVYGVIEDDNKRYKCSYEHAQLIAVAPIIEKFTVNFTRRGCIQVGKDVQDGCHEDKMAAAEDEESLDSEAGSGEVPGAAVLSRQGAITCHCHMDKCDAAPCPPEHYTVPYTGHYGYCVNWYILIGLGAGGLLLLLMMLCCCCFLCPRSQSPKAQQTPMAFGPRKHPVYTPSVANYPFWPPHYVGSLDRPGSLSANPAYSRHINSI